MYIEVYSFSDHFNYIVYFFTIVIVFCNILSFGCCGKQILLILILILSQALQYANTAGEMMRWAVGAAHTALCKLVF